MKTLLLSLCMAVAGTSLTIAPLEAEAKRLGGGKAAGMQRQMPAQPAQATPGTPAKPAAPANANQAAPASPAPAAATPPRRSWLGPIAGLAAGLGLAALFSHLGMGAAFGEFITMALLALVAFIAIRWVMGRMRASSPASVSAGPQWATAAAGAGSAAGATSSASEPAAPLMRTAQPLSSPAREAAAGPAGVDLPPLQPVVRTAEGLGTASQFGADIAAYGPATRAMPEGFDAEAFERLAKMVFIRLQAANDTGAVDDLRKFTTPELFASLKQDLLERHGAEQHTDVVELDARLVDTSKEGDQWVASVRFRGLIREEKGAEATPFDELWHLVKPLDDSREWAIAGITPMG